MKKLELHVSMNGVEDFAHLTKAGQHSSLGGFHQLHESSNYSCLLVLLHYSQVLQRGQCQTHDSSKSAILYMLGNTTPG